VPSSPRQILLPFSRGNSICTELGHVLQRSSSRTSHFEIRVFLRVSVRHIEASSTQLGASVDQTDAPKTREAILRPENRKDCGIATGSARQRFPATRHPGTIFKTMIGRRSRTIKAGSHDPANGRSGSPHVVRRSRTRTHSGTRMNSRSRATVVYTT
jgi:hypothetical protein